MVKRRASERKPAPPAELAPAGLRLEVQALIDAARERTARAVNVELVLLHWQIGQRIRTEILGEERAEYGERVVEGLSGALTEHYGRGFSRRNLFQMIRFAEVFRDARIVQTLSAQLSWSHFMRELERFLLELGSDFTFVTRQKRMTIGRERSSRPASAPPSGAPRSGAPHPLCRRRTKREPSTPDPGLGRVEKENQALSGPQRGVCSRARRTS